MNPEEFVGLSGKLVTMGPAGTRSAVSRAYYGAFHSALGVLKEFGASPGANGRGHALVPIFLKSAHHRDGNCAADLLSNLCTNRVRADYNLDNSRIETVEFARNCVEAATEILKHLERFENACRADSTVQEALRNGVQRIKDSFRV